MKAADVNEWAPLIGAAEIGDAPFVKVSPWECSETPKAGVCACSNCLTKARGRRRRQDTAIRHFIRQLCLDTPKSSRCVDAARRRHLLRNTVSVDPPRPRRRHRGDGRYWMDGTALGSTRRERRTCEGAFSSYVTFCEEDLFSRRSFSIGEQTSKRRTTTDAPRSCARRR